MKTLFSAAENGVLGRGNNVFRNKLSPDGLSDTRGERC